MPKTERKKMSLKEPKDRRRWKLFEVKIKINREQLMGFKYIEIILRSRVTINVQKT